MGNLTKIVLVSLGLLIVTVLTAGAETRKVLAEKNEFGGQTVEVTYAKGDKEFEIRARTLIYLDGGGKTVKTEAYNTPGAAADYGDYKVITYFDTNGKQTKLENYYTDTFALESGVSRSIAHYDDKGNQTKMENYLTDKRIKEISYHKQITYFDENGKRIKYENYYNEKYAEEEGYDRLAVYFQYGEPVKREYYKGDVLVRTKLSK